MAVTALTLEDCTALMKALESRSPGVRRARVAEYLFLPEPVVRQPMPFILGFQSMART